jgi:predicted small metal-binding protein
METDDSGFVILEKVKELKINSAVIILTANDTVEDCRKSFKAGVRDYISKNMRGNPFEELHKSIQESLTYLRRWGGNKEDTEWIDRHINELCGSYLGKFVAVINNTVIESADTEEEVLHQAAAHAQSVHNVTELKEDIVEKVRAAIRDEA